MILTLFTAVRVSVVFASYVQRIMQLDSESLVCSLDHTGDSELLAPPDFDAPEYDYGRVLSKSREYQLEPFPGTARYVQARQASW